MTKICLNQQLVNVDSKHVVAKNLALLQVEVKVTTKVAVESVELAVADKDQGSAGKVVKLQHPKKVRKMLSVHARDIILVRRMY